MLEGLTKEETISFGCIATRVHNCHHYCHENAVSFSEQFQQQLLQKLYTQYLKYCVCCLLMVFMPSHYSCRYLQRMMMESWLG